jgi:membrane-associated phospholipid phosphatase
MSKRYFLWQFLLVLAILIACFCAYHWLDRPISSWAWEHHLQKIRVFRVFSELPEFLTDVIILSAAIIFLQSLLGLRHPPSRLIYWLTATLVSAYAVALVLKFIFGRAGPRLWIKSNFSDSDYGFFWLQGIHKNYQLFPSGHMVLLLTLATIAWFKLPIWRTHIFILSALAMISIIVLNYHFLSDCIAGAYLGYIAGQLSVYFLKKYPTLDK